MNHTTAWGGVWNGKEEVIYQGIDEYSPSRLQAPHPGKESYSSLSRLCLCVALREIGLFVALSKRNMDINCTAYDGHIGSMIKYAGVLFTQPMELERVKKVYNTKNSRIARCGEKACGGYKVKVSKSNSDLEENATM